MSRHGVPACRVCGEHLHDAKSVARCFTRHPLPRSWGRLAEFNDGIERSRPYASGAS
jgi:hypothetical protein